MPRTPAVQVPVAVQVTELLLPVLAPALNVAKVGEDHIVCPSAV
jgi:hypothetical protein